MGTNRGLFPGRSRWQCGACFRNDGDGRGGSIVGAGSAYKQTMQVLRNIASALERAGASIGDVVRTRIYVTRIGDWEEIGRAHGEVFGKIRPTTAMIEVSKLINPEMLVEIEAEAILTSGTGSRSRETSRSTKKGSRRPRR